VQRILTILLVIVLFGIGVYAIGGGFAEARTPYQLPADPLFTAILMGALVSIVVLIGALGGGLAFASTWVTAQLSKDNPGASSGPKASPGTPNPYVPWYSYKATPENAETRQWIIGSVIGLALLLAIMIARGGLTPLFKLAREFTLTQWLIAGGIVVAIIGGIVVVGAGLAFWVSRTTEEKAKVAGAGPMWPSAELATLPARFMAPVESARNMTFLDKALIGLDVLLVLTIVGIVVVWVVPAFSQIGAVDAVRFPPVAPVAEAATAAPAAASGSSDELKKEFAALPPGNADAAKSAFAVLPCASCHSLTPDVVVVGPSLAGMGARAASHRPGYSAELYIYESITNPGAYVMNGFSDGLMPKNFKDILTPQQIADLVAYLSSLK
jgi:cytochrome c2